jgi:NAD(P)-dependent dehydrogenase (short-subunit alcohol dehydrogenase family)
VTSQEQWEAAVGLAVSNWGGLDILLNNAGLGDLAVIKDTSLDDWARTISVDQTGVFLGMNKSAAALAALAHGSVINISSIFGASGGFGTSPAYHAAKGAVSTLEEHRTAPGRPRDTGELHSPRLHRHPAPGPGQGHTHRAGDARHHAHGRLGQPEEVANAE